MRNLIRFFLLLFIGQFVFAGNNVEVPDFALMNRLQDIPWIAAPTLDQLNAIDEALVCKTTTVQIKGLEAVVLLHLASVLPKVRTTAESANPQVRTLASTIVDAFSSDRDPVRYLYDLFRSGNMDPIITTAIVDIIVFDQVKGLRSGQNLKVSVESLPLNGFHKLVLAHAAMPQDQAIDSLLGKLAAIKNGVTIADYDVLSALESYGDSCIEPTIRKLSVNSDLNTYAQSMLMQAIMQRSSAIPLKSIPVLRKKLIEMKKHSKPPVLSDINALQVKLNQLESERQ